MTEPDERASDAEVQGCAGCLYAVVLLAALGSLALGVPPSVAWIVIIVATIALAVVSFRRA